MKGIIMNTKKIYITPEINVMNIMTTYIMAGSNNRGTASGGAGTDSAESITVSPGTGGSGGSASSDGPVVQAKNNSFNAWETWEEY